MDIAPKLNIRPEPKRKRFEDIPTPWGLSAMEYQVVLRVREGLTLQQVAKALALAEKTAQEYATRAKCKMLASTLAHMAVLFDRWDRSDKPAPLEVVLRFENGRPSVQMREVAA